MKKKSWALTYHLWIQMYPWWKQSRSAQIYSGDHERPPVDRDTFITLAKIPSGDVLMSTHDGYYQQVDGLAMGSPPAPHLANGWFSHHQRRCYVICKVNGRHHTEYQKSTDRTEAYSNQQFASISQIYHWKRGKWIHTIPGHEDHPQQWTTIIHMVQDTNIHRPHPELPCPCTKVV